MKFYEYLDLSITSTKVPVSSHLFVCTDTAGTIYMVPDDDTDNWYKSTDKGASWGSALGYGNSCTIDGCRPDLDNDKLYYWCHNVGTEWRLRYINLTNDSDNAVLGGASAVPNLIICKDYLIDFPVEKRLYYKLHVDAGGGSVTVYMFGHLADLDDQNMGTSGSRTERASGAVLINGDEGWFLWQFSNENVELWKYHEGDSSFTEMVDFGANTELPLNKSLVGLAYDGSDIFYTVLAVGTKEVSTIVADTAANIDDGDYITLSAFDKTGTEINYYLWFDKVGDESGDPAPGGKTKITADISGDVTAQDVSDTVTAVFNARGTGESDTMFAANGSGTSTTVTITCHASGNVTNIADVDSGLVVATTVPGVAAVNYLYSYSITGDVKTQLGQYDISLMLNSNVQGSALPNTLEKGYHISSYKVYQLKPVKDGITKIAEPGSDAVFKGITDTFLINDDGDMFEYTDISDTKLDSCTIDYKMGKVTIATFRSTVNLATLDSVSFYDDSDVLLFEGTVVEKEYVDESIFDYKAIGRDTEIVSYKVTSDQTAGDTDAKVIIEAVLDSADWLYYDSSISTPAIDIKADFKNLPFKDFMDTIADRCDYVWYVAPDGKVWFDDGQTASGDTISESAYIYGEPRFKIMGTQINKVILYGGFVNGVRLTSTSEDTASQLINGVHEYIDHYPHITDQTELDTLAGKIRGRSGMATNPYYITVPMYGLEFVQCGTTINFAFSPLSYAASDDILLEYRYNAKEDSGVAKLSTGIVQNVWRGYGVHGKKTRSGDEEQLDILAGNFLGLPALTDPGADRILFWDDSATLLKWLTVSTGVDVTTTNLTGDLVLDTTPVLGGALDTGGNSINDDTGDDIVDINDALNVQGDITLTGTVDTVDVAAFKTAYDAHLHDGDTLQCDGITSDGGAFTFTASASLNFKMDGDANDYIQFTTVSDIPYINGKDSAMVIDAQDGDMYIRSSGSIRMQASNDNSDYWRFYTSSNVPYMSNEAANAYIDCDGILYIRADSTIQIYPTHGSGIAYNFNNAAFYPATDKGPNFGITSTNRWDECYADNYHNEGPKFIDKTGLYDRYKAMEIKIHNDKTTSVGDSEIDTGKFLTEITQPDRYLKQYDRKFVGNVASILNRSVEEVRDFCMNTYKTRDDCPDDVKDGWMKPPIDFNPDDYGVSLNQWLLVNTHVIQELMQKNEDLENRIKILEGV